MGGEGGRGWEKIEACRVGENWREELLLASPPLSHLWLQARVPWFAWRGQVAEKSTARSLAASHSFLQACRSSSSFCPPPPLPPLSVWFSVVIPTPTGGFPIPIGRDSTWRTPGRATRLQCAPMRSGCAPVTLQ